MLQTLPADSGAAFIVILHLDPTRSSHIAEILRSATQLPVVEARRTIAPLPDHVYVITPNSKLSLVDGVLEVAALGENEARGGLVDYLFSSLAEAEGPRAVGIVMSGAGHDGSAGLRAIKNAGGLGIVQDPDSAGAAGMPQSAIDAKVADAVLPLDAIWPIVAAFAEDGSRPEPRARLAADNRRNTQPEPPNGAAADGFQRILRALGELADINFDDYKEGTLARRTRRRMGLKQLEGWDQYADFLSRDRDELDALYQDVLIGVTAFFRDPSVWDQLAAHFQDLIEKREKPGFRAWVPGCGSGEEAYSLAILAHERVPAADVSKIQIYATDANPRALATARRGIYTVDALHQVDPERRQRYFHPRDDKLQVDRSIRDCVTFAPHNVLNDPPFSAMDLVTCRNLLIYLKPQAHDRLLRRLHFALRPGGLLMLGSAERLGRQTHLFDEISKHHSIFRARTVAKDRRFQVTPRVNTPERPRGSPALVAEATQLRAWPPGPDRRIEQFVLRQHTAACVVINVDCEIQHLYGPIDRYLVPPTGESRQDLLAWIRPGFYVRLRSVLRQAVDSGESIDTEGHIERDNAVWRVRCSIAPIPPVVGVDGLFLLTFRDVTDTARQQIDLSGSDEPVVREIEQELHDTRRELQATQEQLESAGEEHRASHEELLSLNEELQSSNEELEASKEELEALNEEMNTINRELEQKNIDLREANGDLHNLFLSTGVPTVFLNGNLHIRRFTNAATEVMCLVSSDIGRSIEHVKERFNDGLTWDKCRRVLETLEPDSGEVRTTNGRFFMRNILPYRNEHNGVEGICITFIDVSEQKREAQRSEAAHLYSETIIRTVRTPLLVLDADTRIESMNDAFRSAFGADDTYIGQPLADTRDRRWNIPRLDDVLAPVLTDGKAVNDYEVVSRDRYILINARRVTHVGERSRIVLSFEDVTSHRAERRQAERRTAELGADAERKDQWIAMLGHELRNPVSAVSNGILLLKSDNIAAEREQQLVTMMDRQIGHVSCLLDELLDAARIVAGKLEIERQPVDLTDIAVWATDAVNPLMEEFRHRLSTDLPPAGTVWVDGDRVRLTEVLVNLLTNAAKYTDVGGKIRLDVTADDDTVTVCVSDTGIGIDSNLKDHIFEIFTQGPRPLDRATRGLGLGLPLVRSLVQAHGGRVEVFSDGAGRGSEFRVTLPRMAHVGEPEAAVAAEATSARSPSSSSRRVLIVDDVRDAADSLALLVQTYGHETKTAADGPAALAIALVFQPEIAFLDLGLPCMDGYELARRLRHGLPSTTLVAITGYQENTATLTAAGFDHYLSKPIDMARLSSLLADDRS